MFKDHTDFIESNLMEPVEDLGESMDEILYNLDNGRVPEYGKQRIETELQDPDHLIPQ